MKNIRKTDSYGTFVQGALLDGCVIVFPDFETGTGSGSKGERSAEVKEPESGS